MPPTESSGNCTTKPKCALQGTCNSNNSSSLNVNKLQARSANINSKNTTARSAKSCASGNGNKHEYIRSKTAAKPKNYSAKLNAIDWSELKSRAKIIGAEERQAECERREDELKRLECECEERKARFKAIDSKRASKKKPSVDSEAIDEVQKVHDRVTLARQEQQEEVRRANGIILSTKCQIIRDAQVAEKTEIERELRAENLKLEKMINDDCEKMLEIEMKADQEKKKLAEQHAIELKKQLKYRELIRTLEAERIEEEAKMNQKAQIMVTKEMKEQEEERKKRIQKIRSDLQKSNELSEQFKQIQFEEQRMADLKIQQYMKQKHEKEVKLKKEKQLKREQEERERERLLNLQTRLLETKTLQSEKGMRRELEEKEREFRRKEKEAVMKRKKQIQELDIARQIQLEDYKRQKALEIAREEHEHLRVVEKIEKSLEDDKRKAELKRIQNEKYRTEIVRQMNERESKDKELLNRSKIEYQEALQKEEDRLKMIQCVLQNKIKNMKANNVPQKFINEVERQLSKTKPFTQPQ